MHRLVWGAVASWLVRSTPLRPGSSPGQGHCIVLFCKTLDSYSASLHPAVQMGNPCDRLVSHPRGVEIILAASCYKISSNQTVRKCFLSGYPFSLCVTRKQTKARVLFTTRQVHHYSFQWSFATLQCGKTRATCYIALTWCDHLARA